VKLTAFKPATANGDRCRSLEIPCAQPPGNALQHGQIPAQRREFRLAPSSSPTHRRRLPQSIRKVGGFCYPMCIART
jgi:hypothetical protein